MHELLLLSSQLCQKKRHRELIPTGIETCDFIEEANWAMGVLDSKIDAGQEAYGKILQGSW